jgi:predicted ester cyclase
MISTLWKNLRVRFLLLVLLAVLPALGLLVYSANEQQDFDVEEATTEASRLASLAAADQDRVIESTRQLLVVLARLPEVQSGNAAECDEVMADLLVDFPDYANLGVIAPGGNVTCSAVTLTGPINLSDRTYFQSAVDRKDFAIGEYQIGRITAEATLNCAYPIVGDDGKVQAVVYAALKLDSLNEFAAAASLPQGATLTVIDRAGQVLVRRPEPDEWIGKSLRGTPVVERMLSEGAGTMEAPGDDGTYLYAFVPLGGGTSTDAIVSVGLPKAKVIEPAERAFSRSLTRLGLVFAAVLVAAWVGSDLLVRRTAEANKAIVLRLYAAFDTGGVDLLDEVVDPGFLDHDPMPGQAPGLAGLKQAVGMFRAAFPDGELSAEEVIAEDDKVVARVTMRGTHLGEFHGAPPTGQVVTAEGVETYRIARGKIAEGWGIFGPMTPTKEIAPTRQTTEVESASA